MAVEMHERCPACGSGDYSFVVNDEAECDSCGERFYPDVSGERYHGPAIAKLYHVTSADLETLKREGLDADRNTHGWVYLTRDPKPWLEYFSRPGQVVHLLELDATALELFRDPAGYAADFYVEQSLEPSRITRFYRYDKPAGS